MGSKEKKGRRRGKRTKKGQIRGKERKSAKSIKKGKSPKTLRSRITFLGKRIQTKKGIQEFLSRHRGNFSKNMLSFKKIHLF